MDGVDGLQFKHRHVWLISHHIHQWPLTCKLHKDAHSIGIDVRPFIRQIFDSLSAVQNHDVLRKYPEI